MIQLTGGGRDLSRGSELLFSEKTKQHLDSKDKLKVSRLSQLKTIFIQGLNKMAMLDEYSYLWDGSQEGWCLALLPPTIGVTIFFLKEGAVAKDLMKLKSSAPSFFNFSAGELLRQFKGKKKIELGQMDLKIANELLRTLKASQFDVALGGQVDRYVIVNQKSNTILSIENNEMYKAIKNKMLVNNIPVISEINEAI